MAKRISILFMVVVLVLTFAVGTSAKLPDDGGVSPQWQYMSVMNVDLSFDGTSGRAYVSVGRISQVTTSLEGTIAVYKRVGNVWEFVASNSGSSTRSLVVDVNFSCQSGVTYKAIASVTAYGANGSETDSAGKTKVCP